MSTLASPPRTAAQARLLSTGIADLADTEPLVAALLDEECEQQSATLALVASASAAAPAVLAVGGAALSNVTAEGYPGARYHPGAARFDELERLARRRARTAFGARYANVQPHSCSSANLSVLTALLPAGGVILSLGLDDGGHLTHGSAASITGSHFRPVHYGLDRSGHIDHGSVRALAAEHRPGVLIAGASAYPRSIDFDGFRRIADEVGAYLLADISHIAGLVAAGAHPSPIDAAHVTTTSTYKQLGGPRGGLILSGRDHDTPGPDGRTPLSTVLDRAVFPRVQGTPSPAAIAAKAVALGLVDTPAFRSTARRIVATASALAAHLSHLGYRPSTGGTDNHLVLVDLRSGGRPELSGVVAERALAECGILANRNRVSGDTRSPMVTSGLRLGTNIAAQRGLGPAEMARCARLVHTVLGTLTVLDDTRYRLDPDTRRAVRAEVRDICARFPLPGYPQDPR